MTGQLNSSQRVFWTLFFFRYRPHNMFLIGYHFAFRVCLFLYRTLGPWLLSQR